MRLLARIRCALLGHADTVIRWGVARVGPGNVVTRELDETCTRCDAVVNVSEVRLEEGRWTA